MAITNASNWLDVDRRGLAEILERRGKAWAVYELIANAFDEDGVTYVNVTITPEDGKRLVNLIVEDDAPNGFADLKDSWTLFAPSKKKAKADKRGRFNFGCKLVLAMCREATIVTTTGGVVFDNAGRRSLRHKREKGSEFSGMLHMTREEMREAIEGCSKLIVPSTIVVTVNGERIPSREPLTTFQASSLMTDIADEDGFIKRIHRACEVKVYHPRIGEVASIYEMGIPVVETGDAYHIDVGQKVPLSLERDNVPPSFLRDIRAQVLHATRNYLSDEAKASSWVTEAITDPYVSPAALESVVTARFGKERVAYDPSDKEANNRAVARGYTVVHGGSLPGEAWDKIKTHGLILPAGRVTPTPSAFSADGDPYETIEIAALDPQKRKMVGFAMRLADELLGIKLNVDVVKDGTQWSTIAAWRRGGAPLGMFPVSSLLILNVDKVPWTSDEQFLELMLHEFAHQYESNHLSEKFHDAICMLGAKLARATYRYKFIPISAAYDDRWVS